jgi:hypothetical protein
MDEKQKGGIFEKNWAVLHFERIFRVLSFRDRSKKRGDREEERLKRGIQFERRKGREAPRHATVHSSPIRKPTRSSSSARAEN